MQELNVGTVLATNRHDSGGSTSKPYGRGWPTDVQNSRATESIYQETGRGVRVQV